MYISDKIDYYLNDNFIQLSNEDDCSFLSEISDSIVYELNAEELEQEDLTSLKYLLKEMLRKYCPPGKNFSQGLFSEFNSLRSVVDELSYRYRNERFDKGYFEDIYSFGARLRALGFQLSMQMLPLAIALFSVYNS